VHVLVAPTHEEPCSADTIFFGHHLVAISEQPDIFQVHVLGLHPSLIEPLGDTVRLWPMIAGLSGDIQHRNSFQVDEFARRFLLDPARIEVWTIGLLLSNGLQLRGFFGWAGRNGSESS
jgi:hypothetical protein